MLDRNSYTGRCIDWLRLPLALMIVLGHYMASFSFSDPSVWINGFVCRAFIPVALDAFFLISGFLFFAGRDSFSGADYFSALRRRIRTLLLPYILWSLIALAFMVLMGHPWEEVVASDPLKLFLNGHFHNISVSLLGYHTTLWGFPEVNAALWFLRDLMAVTLMTPLIWWLARPGRGRMLIVLAVLCILLHVSVPGLSADALFYFILGSALAVSRVDFIATSHRHAALIISFWLTLYIVYSVCSSMMDPNHLTFGLKVSLLRNVYALTGVFALMAIAARALYPHSLSVPPRLNRLNRFILAGASAGFFIYMAHNLSPFESLEHHLRLLIPSEHWRTFIGFFLINPLKIALLIALWYVLRRCAPRVYALLDGSRPVRHPDASPEFADLRKNR